MGAKFRLEAGGGGAVELVRKLNKLLDGTEKGFKDAANEAAKLERAAKRIVRETEGPQERLNKKLRETQDLFKKGKLTLDEAYRATRKYREELDKLGRSGDRTFGSTAVSQIKSYATSFLGVTGIIAGIRSEINALRAEGERVAQAKLGAAAARRGLRRQIANATPEEQELVLSTADRLAGELKLPQARIDSALREGISASPSVQRGVDFAEFGLKLNKELSDPNASIGAAIDIANAINTSDPYRASGFLNIVEQTSRATDPQKVAENAPRVINAVVQAGGRPEVGGALFAGLTVGSADKNTEVSRTAGINLIDRLNKFFTETKVDGVTREDSDTFAEQIALVLGSEAIGQQFISSKYGQSFRAASRPGVGALIGQPQSQARAAYDRALRLLGDANEQRRAGERVLDFVGGGTQERAAEAERIIASGAEQGRLSAPDTLSEQARTDIVEAIKSGRRLRASAFDSVNALDPVVRSELTVATGATLERDEAASYLRREASQLAGSDFGQNPRFTEQIAILRSMADSLQSLDRKANAPTTQQE